MAGGLVTIAQYRDLPEAGLAKPKLEAAGIACFLDNEYTVGANWLYSNALGGVKLNVPEENAEEVKAIIEEIPEVITSEESEGMLPESACSACGATEIETQNYTRKFAALALLISLPLFLFWKRYRCKSCGHRWKCSTQPAATAVSADAPPLAPYDVGLHLHEEIIKDINKVD